MNCSFSELLASSSARIASTRMILARRVFRVPDGLDGSLAVCEHDRPFVRGSHRFSLKLALAYYVKQFQTSVTPDRFEVEPDALSP
jgi:hypothetical protein